MTTIKPVIIKRSDGYREWWVDGQRHRTDGPAVEWANGYRAWYQNGERQNKEAN